MGSRLLQDGGALRNPGALGVPAPAPPTTGTRWPRSRPPEADPVAARLARHVRDAWEAEGRAREAALAGRWPLSRLRAREAERLAADAAGAALLQDAVAALTGELRAANARIDRLERALEARGASVMAALLDRLLTGQLDDVRAAVLDSRAALDGRVNALETALEERFSWVGLEIDALEVRVRSAAKPPDRSREDLGG